MDHLIDLALAEIRAAGPHGLPRVRSSLGDREIAELQRRGRIVVSRGIDPSGLTRLRAV